jgi:hypothetical protein
MLRPGFELANPEDLQIPCCVDNATEAVAVIRDHHARWLTARGRAPDVWMRQVGGDGFVVQAMHVFQ